MALPRYEVSKNGIPVLFFRAQPGHLVSTAPRPPGFKSPTHPFLDAQALDAAHEGQLAELLGKATSAEQFIATLRTQGFEVRTQEPA